MFTRRNQLMASAALTSIDLNGTQLVLCGDPARDGCCVYPLVVQQLQAAYPQLASDHVLLRTLADEQTQLMVQHLYKHMRTTGAPEETSDGSINTDRQLHTVCNTATSHETSTSDLATSFQQLTTSEKDSPTSHRGYQPQRSDLSMMCDKTQNEKDVQKNRRKEQISHREKNEQTGHNDCINHKQHKTNVQRDMQNRHEKDIPVANPMQTTLECSDSGVSPTDHTEVEDWNQECDIEPPLYVGYFKPFSHFFLEKGESLYGEKEPEEQSKYPVGAPQRAKLSQGQRSATVKSRTASRESPTNTSQPQRSRPAVRSESHNNESVTCVKGQGDTAVEKPKRQQQQKWQKVGKKKNTAKSKK